MGCSSVMSDYLWPHGLQHARPPCPSATPGACSNSCPSIRWCHPTISFSVIPFSSCLQSFPASGSFLMSWLFASGGQCIGASASVFPMNIQGWYPLGFTGLICLQSKRLSRVFSNTTVQLNQKITNASCPLKYGLFFPYMEGNMVILWRWLPSMSIGHERKNIQMNILILFFNWPWVRDIVIPNTKLNIQIVSIVSWNL